MTNIYLTDYNNSTSKYSIIQPNEIRSAVLYEI